MLIGTMTFVGPQLSPADAIRQAKHVGAAIVAVSSKYQNTVLRRVPITAGGYATTYNTGAGNTFATGGSGPGRYIGRSGSHGAQTSYVSFSVDLYDYKAMFFAPAAPLDFRPYNLPPRRAAISSPNYRLD